VGRILYVIWDYTDRLIDAIDDTAGLNENTTVDINVLANDQLSGVFDVISATDGAIGTTTILPDNQVRYTNTGGTGADVFTYTVVNENAQDTANVRILVVTPGGGPTTEFNISPTGEPNNNGGEGACPLEITDTKFHDGVNVYPTLGDTVYNDAAGLDPYDGNDLYYAINNGRAILIANDGEILDLWICGAGSA
jgi:hypothetical protein